MTPEEKQQFLNSGLLDGIKTQEESSECSRSFIQHFRSHVTRRDGQPFRLSKHHQSTCQCS